MHLKIDPDLMELVTIVQSKFPADKLVGLSAGLCAIAPAIWGRYGNEPIIPISLISEPISDCDQQTRPCANE
jgi:hypothetical protein